MLPSLRVTRKGVFVSVTFEWRPEKEAESAEACRFPRQSIPSRDKSKCKEHEGEVYPMYYRKHKEGDDAGAKGDR